MLEACVSVSFFEVAAMCGTLTELGGTVVAVSD
jgi:hypothetical protein